MDMGFVRGTKFSVKDEDGHIKTSLDGYNSYLVVVDRPTRYTWVFLSRYKTPMFDNIKTFLHMYGVKDTVHHFIRTDQGGKLWGSHAFQCAVKEMCFILQPTTSDASFQNGVAEQPNRTLADMMRSLLHSANLGPEYWSWALIHAVYLKNRLPHRSIGTTPYQAFTGKRWNIKKLCLFGCPIVAQLPGRRPTKLDIHATTGIFLGFTATSKISTIRIILQNELKQQGMSHSTRLGIPFPKIPYLLHRGASNFKLWKRHQPMNPVKQLNMML
jgi:hypothetical protein